MSRMDREAVKLLIEAVASGRASKETALRYVEADLSAEQIRKLLKTGDAVRSNYHGPG